MKTKKLIAVLRKKRNAKGLSIRALSSVIGVSFSTLARIERGDGKPDNNTLIRILEWLGEDGRESGLSFKSVAFVHFRASKNINSKTVHCLLQAADILKSNHDGEYLKVDDSSIEDQSSFPSSKAIILSKPEMETMAQQFREELKVDEADSLDALGIEVEGVNVFIPGQVPDLSEECLSHLNNAGSDDWSAMSVPLDSDNEKWAILRNDQHALERQRVTFLEECWHILLGHKLTKIAKISNFYGRTYDSNEEHDAFYLASATLLPEKVVSKAVSSKKSTAEIAEDFGTSPDLVEYRIKRLGLWRNHKGKEIKLVDSST